jgi:cytochrome c nitrite reductase small subunit
MGADQDDTSFEASRHPAARRMLWAAAGAIGVLAGASLFTFTYAEGASYFRNDPSACMNCHIMRDQYEGWQRGPHHHVTTCNDCHTGHSFVGKYASKAVNGFNHSWAFTTGRFPEPLQITPFNRRLAEASCRECHGDFTHTIDVHTRSEEAVSCLRCHADAGH